jgi:hypothetical protein
VIVGIAADDPVRGVKAPLDEVLLRAAPVAKLLLRVLVVEVAKPKLDLPLIVGRHQRKACAVPQRHGNDKVEVRRGSQWPHVIKALLAIPQLSECFMVDDVVENGLDALVVLQAGELRSDSKR